MPHFVVLFGKRTEVKWQKRLNQKTEHRGVYNSGLSFMNQNNLVYPLFMANVCPDCSVPMFISC